MLGMWQLGCVSMAIAKSSVLAPGGFQGRHRDTETGLYFYRLRTYHPNLGRFMQRDPLSLSGLLSSPELNNLYLFELNNPAALLDPMGGCTPPPGGGAGPTGQAGCCCCVKKPGLVGTSEALGKKSYGNYLEVKFELEQIQWTKNGYGGCTLKWREKTKGPQVSQQLKLEAAKADEEGYRDAVPGAEKQQADALAGKTDAEGREIFPYAKTEASWPRATLHEWILYRFQSREITLRDVPQMPMNKEHPWWKNEKGEFFESRILNLDVSIESAKDCPCNATDHLAKSELHGTQKLTRGGKTPEFKWKEPKNTGK